MVRSLSQLPFDLCDYLVCGSPLFDPRGASPRKAPYEFSEVYRVLVRDAVPCPHRPLNLRRRHGREHLSDLQPLKPVFDMGRHVDQVDESVARVVPPSADLRAVRPPTELHAQEHLPVERRFGTTRPIHFPKPAGPVPGRDRRPLLLFSRLLGVKDAQTRHRPFPPAARPVVTPGTKYGPSTRSNAPPSEGNGRNTGSPAGVMARAYWTQNAALAPGPPPPPAGEIVVRKVTALAARSPQPLLPGPPAPRLPGEVGAFSTRRPSPGAGVLRGPRSKAVRVTRRVGLSWRRLAGDTGR